MSAKAIVGALLVVVCAGSVTARVVMGDGEDPAPEAPAVDQVPGSTGLLPGQQPSGSPEADRDEDGGALEEAMPIVSEASFFGFIGFALGYLARKVLKLAMIFIAVFFIGLQGLAFLEVISIDWGRALDVFNSFVLNLEENQDLADILKDRIPTVGALAAGYVLGFRKG